MSRIASSAAADASGSADAQERVLLAWSVRLARRSPGRSAVVGAAVALAAVMGWVLLRSPLAAVVSGVVIFVSTAEFLIPVRCRLTTLRAAVAAGLSREEIAWSAVRRVVAVRGGLVLSPLERPSRLDAFRGVFLRFGSDAERDAVLGVIRERAPEHLNARIPEHPQSSEEAVDRV